MDADEAPVGETGERGASDRGAIHLEVQDLEIERGGRSLFHGLSCSFRRGEISVVLGGSGSGKSTLLRMICCLLQPDLGEIWFDSDTELVSLSEREAKNFRRHIGMMFQGGALLDALSVFDNLALPLREHTAQSEAEIRVEVHKVFASVDLQDVDELLPGELSGGMLKRAALARALILRPELLLCDEPVSGLDPVTVGRVEALLTRLNRELGITVILTSHHIESTLRIADWIVLLADGEAISGTPAELAASSDPRVSDFLAGYPASIDPSRGRHASSEGRGEQA